MSRGSDREVRTLMTKLAAHELSSGRNDKSPAVARGAREVETKKGLAKPIRMYEVLTTPSAVPRTGGMTSV